MQDDFVKRFMQLFRGLDRAHGLFKVDRSIQNEKGKVNGHARTLAEKPTQAKFKEHLQGKSGIGIVPIMDDGNCYFSAIDFDTYEPEVVDKFVGAAKGSGVPLVYCKSKSGGAHLYTFFSKPANVSKVRAKLSELAKMLGHPKIEIFPKQEQLDTDGGQVGNWINLPYFEAPVTDRYGYDADGNPLDLAQFLDYAEACLVDPETFYDVKIQQQEIPFSDGPPCIQAMASQGVGSGERNKALFQFALYAKKKYGSEWQDRVIEWNDAYFDPKLAIKEITSTIFKSLDREKDYNYLCKEPVCSELCNSQLCKTREYGINGGVVQAWEDWTIEGTRKVVEELATGALKDRDPRYILSINGRDIEFSRKELQSNAEFRGIVLEVLNVMPPRMNNAMWDQLFQTWLADPEVIVVPYELTGSAKFETLLADFIESAPEGQTRADLHQGMILSDETGYQFKYESFKKFLDNKRYPAERASDIYNLLHKLGVRKKSTTTTGNRKLNYWTVPFSFMTDAFE